MPHEEELDEILKFILVNKAIARQNLYQLKFTDPDLLLKELLDKEYVGQNKMPDRPYYITKRGEMFIESGGYTGQKKRERRAQQVGEFTLSWTKIAAIAAIVAAVLSAIAIVIQLYASK